MLELNEKAYELWDRETSNVRRENLICLQLHLFHSCHFLQQNILLKRFSQWPKHIVKKEEWVVENKKSGQAAF
jgi:hypothetical protein